MGTGCVSPSFRIPMRGYETEIVCENLQLVEVPNPHEGL